MNSLMVYTSCNQISKGFNKTKERVKTLISLGMVQNTKVYYGLAGL